ncbi:MAG: acyl-CoA thioesterase [Pseudomonadota bacterium]
MQLVLYNRIMDTIRTIKITFGDCDPAGIVFYPNFFRWMDATFHEALRPYGGHGAVSKQFEAVGIGLVDANAAFKSPARDGDILDISMTIAEWRPKLINLSYIGRTGENLVFEGWETRGLFVARGTSVSLGDTVLLVARTLSILVPASTGCCIMESSTVVVVHIWAAFSRCLFALSRLKCVQQPGWVEDSMVP